MNAEAQRRAACCELVLEVARTAGEVRLKVTGASMLPTVWPGDVLTVQRCEMSELQPGQIVLYRRDAKLTAHRITSMAGDCLIARGDALPCCDPPVGAPEVVGRVVSIVRNGRSIHPEQLVWHRTLGWILRRSEVCARILLRLGGIVRGSELVPAGSNRGAPSVRRQV